MTYFLLGASLTFVVLAVLVWRRDQRQQGQQANQCGEMYRFGFEQGQAHARVKAMLEEQAEPLREEKVTWKH
jgi:hypothetical protein